MRTKSGRSPPLAESASSCPHGRLARFQPGCGDRDHESAGTGRAFAGQLSAKGFLLGARPIQSRDGDNSTILPAAIVDSAQRGEILHVPQVIIASDLDDIDLVPALDLCSLGA